MNEAYLKALATGDTRIISLVTREQALAEMNRQKDEHDKDQTPQEKTNDN